MTAVALANFVSMRRVSNADTTTLVQSSGEKCLHYWLPKKSLCLSWSVISRIIRPHGYEVNVISLVKFVKFHPVHGKVSFVMRKEMVMGIRWFGKAKEIVLKGSFMLGVICLPPWRNVR